MIDDGIVHGCWFSKECWHHRKLYWNGVWPSKSWPHRDHCIRNPCNQESSTNQHCHLMRKGIREQNQQTRRTRAWSDKSGRGAGHLLQPEKSNIFPFILSIRNCFTKFLRNSVRRSYCTSLSHLLHPICSELQNLNILKIQHIIQ